MPVAPGVRFGPYEVVAPIGAGGMGEVYRARDLRLDRHVALKILPGGPTADERLIERFRREARAISRLSHPNICSLFDVGDQDGTSYLVMECLEGETLAARLTRGPLPVDEAMRYGLQIADGLAHAHAAGVVHRDLKPGNLMLVADGLIKILDFGLAKNLEPTSGDETRVPVSMDGLMVGTVAYMSPEQTLGTTVDHRCDIFSLGVVLYEMLAGIRPFEGNSAFSVMQKINTYEPPGPEFYRPSLPPPLGLLLRRLMAKSPDLRPDSAKAVANELRTIAGISVSGVHSPAVMTVARRRVPGLAVAAGVLLAAAVVVAAIPSLREAVTSRLRSRSTDSTAAQSSSPPVALPSTAYEAAQLGQAYLERFDRPENVQHAIEAFGRAVQIDPNHAFAYAGLAEAFLRKDAVTPDPQWIRQAMESARKSVALNSDLAAAHAVLGVVLLRAKEIEAGRKELERALDEDPKLLLAQIGMGEYHIAKGEPAEAEKVYRRAAQTAPDSWRPLQELGRNLYSQARYAEAAAVWEAARQKTPDNVLVLRNLGAVYHMLDRTEEAAAAFQRALEIQPTATVYSNLGTLRFFQGRYSDAAGAFEKAVEGNPTYFLYWANLGDAYRWIPGAEEKAKQAYSRAVTLADERVAKSPEDPNLRTQLAVYLAKRGDATRARQQLEVWNTLNKKTPASHFRAALVHEIVGDRNAALDALGAAIAAGYALNEIRGEPELAKLRGDPRYHRLVAAFETAKATSNPPTPKR